VVRTNEENSITAQAIAKEYLPVTEWVRVLKRGYMLEDDFSANQKFIYTYVHNLSSYDILFTRDVAYSFLKDDALKENYLGKEAMEQLNAIHNYDDEHYAIVKSIIDKRLAEYKEHKFKQSKQL
jgi:hypothetical protein